MDSIQTVVLLLIPVLLPICLGYLFRKIKLFSESDIDSLRKFAVKVSVPFLIFKNLYKADISTLSQFFPTTISFIIISIFYTLTAIFIGRKICSEQSTQNTYIISVMVGNYGFLGWGIMYSFFGNAAFTRAVFFSMFFWPIFLLCGFFVIYLCYRHNPLQKISKILLINAGPPMGTALGAILFNVWKIPIPVPVWDLITNFASFTIPLILFTIGLNFSFRLDLHQMKIILTASFHRLVFGFAFGLIALFIVKAIFQTDADSSRVILMEAVMPSATLSTFFVEYTPLDKKLLSAIIGISTLLSILTMPIWYLVITNYF
jgi:predicted permease